ncbi:PAS domain S-box family protein, partial [Ichthyophthirius multifiliis]
FLQTAGFVPFYNTFIAVLYKNINQPVFQNQQFMTSQYYIHFSFALVSFVLLLLQMLIYIQLYVDANPFSPLPFACNSSFKDGIIKLCLKLFLVGYGVFDPQCKQEIMFIIVAFFYLLFLHITGFFGNPQFNRNVQNLKTILNTIILWLSFNVLLCSFTKQRNEDANSIYFVLSGFPIVCICQFLLGKQRKNQILQKIPQNIKDENEFLQYLYAIIELIKYGKESKIQGFLVQGIFEIHLVNCEKECFCKEYQKEGMDKLNFLIDFSTQESIKYFPNNANFYLLKAFVQQQVFANKFKAVYDLIICEQQQPSFQQSFFIYSFKSFIQDDLIKKETIINEGYGNFQADSMAFYQNQLELLILQIKNTVDLYIQFWKQIIQDSPDVQKAVCLGYQIGKSFEHCQNIYKELQQIDSNNIKCIEVYGNFLLNVINDEVEGQKLIEKLEVIQKNNQQNKKCVENQLQNQYQNQCIIQISGSLNEIGKITNTNADVFELTGYQKDQLINQSINILMPPIYQQNHDSFVFKYLNSAQSQYVGHQRLVLCKNKNKYISSVDILVKVLPNIDQGIQFIGFLNNNGSKQQSDQLIISFIEKSLQVLTISEGFYQEFGINSSIIDYENYEQTSFTIDQIFPNIKKHLEELKKENNQVQIMFDTTAIQELILLCQKNEEEFNDDNLYNNEELEQNYQNLTKQGIIYGQLLFQKNFYKDINVISLKFSLFLNEQIKLKSKYSSHNIDNNQNAIQDKNEKKQINNAEEEEAVSNYSSNMTQFQNLNDFRRKIIDNKTPKIIIFFKNIVFLMFLIINIFSFTDLIKKTDYIQQNKNLIQILYYYFNRNTIISEINYYSLKIYSLQNKYIDYISEQEKINLYNQYKERLNFFIQTLQDYQNQILSHRVQSSFQQFNELYLMYQKTFNKKTLTEFKSFSDAIILFLQSANQLLNSKIEDFQADNQGQIINTQTLIKYYYIQENGVFNLRNASEKRSNLFYDYYLTNLNDQLKVYQIIFIIIVTFIILVMIILIYINFQVVSNNSRIISLFGHITFNEIQQLIIKCESYLKQNNNQASEQIIELIQPDIILQKEGDEQEDAQENSRADKFLNQKSNNKLLIIFKFSSFAIIFLIFYFLKFYYDYLIINDIKNMYFPHLKISLERPSQIKFLILFINEQLVLGKKIIDKDNTILQNQYIERIYDNEKQLFSSFKALSSIYFQDYYSKFNELNSQNICEKSNNLSNQTAICSQVFDGILTKGLRTSVVFYTENFENSFKIKQDQIKVLNFKEFQQLEQMKLLLYPAMDELNNLYLQQILFSMGQNDTINLIIYISFICSVILIYFFILIPYIKQVTIQLFQTRKMLNIIPHKLILNNEQLFKILLKKKPQIKQNEKNNLILNIINIKINLQYVYQFMCILYIYQFILYKQLQYMINIFLLIIDKNYFVNRRKRIHKIDRFLQKLKKFYFIINYILFQFSFILQQQQKIKNIEKYIFQQYKIFKKNFIRPKKYSFLILFLFKIIREIREVVLVLYTII